MRITEYSEFELIESLKAGHILSFDKIYARYHKLIFSNIFRIVKRKEEAEELLQDVFVALWEKRNTIDSNKPVLGWLTIVGYNKTINYVTRAVRNELSDRCVDLVEIPDIADASEINTMFEVQLTILEDAIEQLPARKKQAFTLCKLHGKSYEETASHLGISVNTVKEHIKISMQFIKAHAASQYPSQAFMICAILSLLE